MPSGYVFVDSRTVRGPEGTDHDVLDAIEALPWRAQFCPFMRHEYSIRGKGPAWAGGAASECGLPPAGQTLGNADGSSPLAGSASAASRRSTPDKGAATAGASARMRSSSVTSLTPSPSASAT